MSDHSDFQVTPTSSAIGAESMRPDLVSVLAGDPTLDRKLDKPAHYKVICISMYTKDLKNLDDMVENLKAKGMTKANRSALIRYALGEVNLDEVPQGI